MDYLCAAEYVRSLSLLFLLLIGWLKELKEVVYDAEDVLDDHAYQKLRQSIITTNNTSKLGCYYNLSCFMADINNRKNMFNLQHASSSSPNPVPNNPRETTALVDESKVFGRDTKKVEIVDTLLSHGSTASSTTVTNNDFQTVAIIGLGGIGKTTLAQLAYNDDAIQKHFDLRVWVCVSDDFDTTNLFAQILHQIAGAKPEPSSAKQVLHNNLEKGLKGKKFLLVLDDVWNEVKEKWDDFVLPLKIFGATGSRVLVTSRSRKVASVVEAKETCELEGFV